MPRWLSFLKRILKLPEEKMHIDEKKSRVRVWVTYVATWWVFLMSGLLILRAVGWGGGIPVNVTTGTGGDPNTVTVAVDTAFGIAKDIYMTVLPVATGVITYWFASRGITRKGVEGKPEEAAPDAGS
ncbi:hypothetical protein [Candidatus Palauibacter sp.]|uniref:hypothetical protein n=1 Tax=Candidatus Palauibacter sp. TaxID=3101350 RepID=UPI003D0FC961